MLRQAPEACSRERPHVSQQQSGCSMPTVDVPVCLCVHVLPRTDTLGTERLKAQREQAAHEQCLRDLEDRVQVSSSMCCAAQEHTHQAALTLSVRSHLANHIWRLCV